MLRILITAEHTSARFGGEAALPLHYFRVLINRGAEVWLVTHSRVRSELQALYPSAEERVHYIEDDAFHQWMWRLGQKLPARLAYFTTGLLSRSYTQIKARRVIRVLVAKHGINLVHQPIPVSPKEPSWMFGLGAPLVVGPMNGGIDYPPGFQAGHSVAGRLAVALGRFVSATFHWFIPGKPRAALLLVANQRTNAHCREACLEVAT